MDRNTSVPFARSTFPCTCQRPDRETANDQCFFHADVSVCERVWGGGILKGGVPGGEQNRMDLQLPQRSLGSDTCDIASCWRNGVSQVCTPVVYCVGHSCELHVCVCVCACEKVQIW